MRAFRNLYVDMCHGEQIGQIFGVGKFLARMTAVTISDADFNTQNYVPGTSGETALYNDLMRYLELPRKNTLF